MIFDSDVVIWALRGSSRAAKAIDSEADRLLSAVSYMELLQGARDRRDLRETKGYVSALGFRMLPLTEAIGHRATVYVEEHALRSGMRLADALVAATAAENGLALLTGNVRHYRPIADLELKAFRP